MVERRGLGRGLSALMAESDGPAEQPRSADRVVAIDRIGPNPEQPRRRFNPAALEELAASIREKGVIQPLVLRVDPNDRARYQIVAGERRWRAAQMAQLHEVPAVIRELDDGEVLEIAIVENIQRADLDAIEEAAGYRQLIIRFGHTQERLAEGLGKSRSHIANTMRLLALPEPVQAMVSEGQLSAGHARALLPVDNPLALAKEVVRRGLSVRQTERLAKSNGAKQRLRPPERLADADTKALEMDLTAALGTRVAIDHEPGGAGVVNILYKDLDVLDKICQKLSRAASLPDD